MRALLLALALVACGPATRPPSAEAFGMCKDVPPASCVRGRTVIIVRHAEKAVTTEDDKDPPLSELARARTIAAMLASSGVTKLLSTPFRRTHATLEPLAARTGLPIELLPPSRMREAIKEAPDGAVVIIATHSNMIPALVRELADVKLRGVTGDALDDDDYGRVIVVGQACGAKNAVVTELSSNR